MSESRESGIGKTGHASVESRESKVQEQERARTGEVIRAEGLGKTYAEGKLYTPVFDALDFAVEPGETVAILGASGAGKSTLLHLLGGLDTPTSGEVYVTGQKMSALSDAARGKLRNRALGFVYQFHHLLPEFTAQENVMLPLLLGDSGIDDASSRARALLEAVGLGHRLEHKPGELSGGERQRAAVARALVNRPACVLGDEPTGNLDEKTAATVFELMLDLNRAQQTSLVLVTHDRRLARKLDRVVELHDGRLREVARGEI
ncbi:MAG TPA: lipoprotein-releasing ABC transporter ATP-binding protein LolD [Chiayiivirga sp.]|nr:lipoprotein-releasing ABC transporter ATP-binding protein LolD [Chiayiivirga sp.]HRP72420.1 lipoprotein-releasing ABC transporter ATP-binding protein LolD [Luteimonas sp.]